MTEVCLIGDEELDLVEELFSRDGSREALSSYSLHHPWENTLALHTVSLGAAVSLLNDLDWYLVRFTRDAMVLDDSISDNEWLSRAAAEVIRSREEPPSTDWPLLKVYGVKDNELVEPMYVQRADGGIPSYDLQDVDETVTVRITEDEF